VGVDYIFRIHATTEIRRVTSCVIIIIIIICCMTVTAYFFRLRLKRRSHCVRWRALTPGRTRCVDSRQRNTHINTRQTLRCRWPLTPKRSTTTLTAMADVRKTTEKGEQHAIKILCDNFCQKMHACLCVRPNLTCHLRFHERSEYIFESRIGQH